jgi:hypothetical protein
MVLLDCVMKRLVPHMNVGETLMNYADWLMPMA